MSWQPIETAPKDGDALFWVVPKTADETYLDSNNKPIVTNHEPYLHMGRRGSWSSLSKATHWRPLPAPPVGADNEVVPPDKKEVPASQVSQGLPVDLCPDDANLSDAQLAWKVRQLLADGVSQGLPIHKQPLQHALDALESAQRDAGPDAFYAETDEKVANAIASIRAALDGVTLGDGGQAK